MTRFAVIAVDYENHVPRDGMKKGLESISNQTYKDFDIVICHDGPKEIPYHDEIDFESLGINPYIINTSEKMSNWGHSSRDLAMRYAYENLPECDYYIQFNIDNLLEPQAFEKIAEVISYTKSKIVIFSVRHWKAAGGAPFSGNPPVAFNIDVMQLVAHRDIWKNNNFWYRTDSCSDGFIYEEMCQKNKEFVHIEAVLGDNF